MPRARAPIPGVEHIVAVASGKGGVGKSTVAVNLACALAARGRRVGLLDADVYGPSVPMMLGVDAKPELKEDRRIVPVEKLGLKTISMGMFLGERTPVIWRGPMVTKLITEFFRKVEWGELDYLVLDLPPGTGDAQLTVAQQVPLAGGVIVTTPQDVALLDVKRGITMFEQVNAPVLGVVENMSYHLCPGCGRRHDIFGHGGGEAMARRERRALSRRDPAADRDPRGRRPRHADRRRRSPAPAEPRVLRRRRGDRDAARRARRGHRGALIATDPWRPASGVASVVGDMCSRNPPPST